MTVYGYQVDSILPLPVPAPLEAHYVNGAVSKWRGQITYGPGRVWIDVLGTEPEAAFWLDVESGDATPAAVPGWLDARRKAGLGNGGVYCNRSALPAVLEHAAGREFSLWLATLDGTVTVPAPPASVTLCAVQFAGVMWDGVSVDISAVTDAAYWGRHR